MLGICRGHQLIGIRRGIPFCMDISDSLICHNPQRINIQTSQHEPVHSIDILDEAMPIMRDEYDLNDVPERAIIKGILAPKEDNKLWV